MTLTKSLIVLLMALFALLQFQLWLGDSGLKRYRQLNHGIAQLETELVGQQQKNNALAAEVQDLKTGYEAVEERARNDLSMIKPGEVYYQLVP